MHSARPGYVALLSILIVSSIAATTVLILFITSVNSTLNSGSISDSKIAKTLADACAELGLQRVTNGSLTPCISPTSLCGAKVSFSTGMCKVDSIVDISAGSDGTQWRVRSTGSGITNVITKYIEVEVGRVAQGTAAVVTSWKEVASF